MRAWWCQEPECIGTHGINKIFAFHTVSRHNALFPVVVPAGYASCCYVVCHSPGVFWGGGVILVFVHTLVLNITWYSFYTYVHIYCIPWAESLVLWTSCFLFYLCTALEMMYRENSLLRIMFLQPVKIQGMIVLRMHAHWCVHWFHYFLPLKFTDDNLFPPWRCC